MTVYADPTFVGPFAAQLPDSVPVPARIRAQIFGVIYDAIALDLRQQRAPVKHEQIIRGSDQVQAERR